MEILAKFGLIFAEYFAMWFGAIFGICMASLILGGMLNGYAKKKTSHYETCDDETKEHIAEILQKVKEEKNKQNTTIDVNTKSQKVVFDLPND